MSHKKKTGAKAAKPLPTHLYIGLKEASSLIEREKWGEALLVLRDLNSRFPRRLEVLELLAYTCGELDDSEGFQQAASQLIVLTPDDVELSFSLANAYLTNVRPAQALRHWRRVIEKWPEHPLAGEARELIAQFEPNAREMWTEMGFPEAEAEELAALHEQVNSVMGVGNFKEARRLAEQLTQRAPYFTSGWNNLSQLQWLDGQYTGAIASAQRALQIEPQNIHALANLTRFQLFRGDLPAAQHTAELLRAAPAINGELLLKKAEAFAYLGDDEALADVFETARRENHLPQRGQDPLLYHLMACVQARRGDEKAARRHWKTALDIAPAYELVLDNLDDFKNPIGERHAPWMFPFQNWIEEKDVRDLQALFQKQRHVSDDALTRALQKWLATHDHLEKLTPHLLDRGDEESRQFAFLLIDAARTPFLLQAARDFALGQRGPDAQRYRAAQIAYEAELLQNPLRLWWGGQWKELQLLGFEIHDEPLPRKNKKVVDLLERGQLAMNLGFAEGAEKVYRQALEIEPDAPDLKNNLAATLMMQEREDEALPLLHEIVAGHPEYLFARVSLARVALRDRRLDEARTWLEPLIEKRRFHTSEFRAWAQVQIQMALAEDRPEVAQSWLEMWQEFLPDDPELPQFRKKVKPRKKTK